MKYSIRSCANAVLFAALLVVQARAQSLNPTVLWGVNGGRQIFRLGANGWKQTADPNTAPFSSTNQPLQVSAGADGTAWALDQSSNTYVYDGTKFNLVNGSLGQVSVGSATNVWGVNGGSQVYRWQPSGWSYYPPPSGSTPKQVSVAFDGTVFMVDTGSNVYSYTASSSSWQQMPGSLAQVSVASSNSAWGINGAAQIYQWSGAAWTQIAAPAGATPLQISAGADGAVYLIDAMGNIYSWNGTAWQTVPGSLLQISAGLSDRFAYNSPAVTSKGSWVPITNANALSGGYVQDGTPADTLNFAFTGDSVVLYRNMDPNGGGARAYVDGKDMGIKWFNYPTQQWQAPVVLDHLGAGQHTLQLQTTGFQYFNQTNKSYNAYVDTFGAPSPFLPTADQQAALTRENYYRQLAGVPPASLRQSLDLAAQAHANYNSVNKILDHFEDPAKPNFIGVGPGDRAAYFGYDTGVGEDADQRAGPAQSIDDWINTLYHRTQILDYTLTDIGFGLSYLNNTTESVLDFGGSQGTPPPNRLLIAYPVNGQTSIPLSFSGEIPNPLPKGVNVAGYPISLQIIQPANPTAGTAPAGNQYQLTDSNGNAVPFYTNDPGTDKNIGNDTYAIIPQQPLTPGMKYNVHMTGTDSQGNAFDQAWSFTTIPAATVSFVFGSMDGFNYTVLWNTVGPVTSTSMQYGLTTAYGTTVSETAPGSTSHQASITGIAGGTYHYQITATDASGATYTTPDTTFVFASIPNAQLSFDYTFPARGYAFAGWHTYGPVTSTSVQYGTTTGYGTTVAGQTDTLSKFKNAYTASLDGLTAGTTYHLQVSATDAQGHTINSGDMTFMTAPPQ